MRSTRKTTTLVTLLAYGNKQKLSSSGVPNTKRLQMRLNCSPNRKQPPLSKGCLLSKLNPIVDESGILRVGGRLSRAELTDEERHPIIMPGTHPVTSLLVKHHHEQTKHQGRHFTRGRIRAVGYWSIGEKRLVNRVIHECVTCRKLRGKVLEHPEDGGLT